METRKIEKMTFCVSYWVRLELKKENPMNKAETRPRANLARIYNGRRIAGTRGE